MQSLVFEQASPLKRKRLMSVVDVVCCCRLMWSDVQQSEVRNGVVKMGACRRCRSGIRELRRLPFGILNSVRIKKLFSSDLNI